ncbi:adenylate cyclase type 2 isoform X2 [Salmo salar]|uniref:Adenylate cyclase type 2 isoform X2 n=1 Tax=Salmo salar TaxID=8030 RepID=A0A1S3N953_SALSA|nr:adenylate cyclase type 2 isoform X2 [Salmo salar]|eukprot:XP_014011968.1 PREDICTED: adenylate cyclase type 2-like isoform X2 [Salmo salar]
MENVNKLLLQNVLPIHVASKFMAKAIRNQFKDFYNERSVNRVGLQCLHFLNEIISDFDEGCDVSYSHVCSMVEFAIALKNNLESINQHSFNRFKLRIESQREGTFSFSTVEDAQNQGKTKRDRALT